MSDSPKLKISPKVILIGLAVLLCYALLKPFLEEQFHVKLPAIIDEPHVSQQDEPPTPPLEEMLDTKTPQATDTLGDVAESEVSVDSETESESETASSEPTPQVEADSTPKVIVKETPKVRTGPTPKIATKPTPKIATKPEPAASSNDAEPALGQLKELPGKVYLSTAGLKYTPGSAEGHRLMHVMKHAEDNLDKPVHGVFEVEKKEILVLLDEAYVLAQKRGPPQVKKQEERGRTIYIVDMKKRIGHVGGQRGKQQKHPPCYKIQLVLEDDEVITAYPTQ